MKSASVAIAAAAVAVAGAWACSPRARMCTTSGDCGPARVCVSGRCQTEVADGGAPAIQFARRLVLPPVDLAYVRRGDSHGAALPTIFTLGRERDGDAVLLLRFSLPLTAASQVVEAYVLLERATAVETDPAPIALHAARVADGWDSRSVSWGALPRIEETRSPSTIVREGGPAVVRVDVRDIVRRWAIHDPRDHGIALVAESTTPTGAAFVLVQGAEKEQALMAPPGGGVLGASASDRATGGDLGHAGSGQATMPRLEVYVK
jgi:hypothetical protein